MSCQSPADLEAIAGIGHILQCLSLWVLVVAKVEVSERAPQPQHPSGHCTRGSPTSLSVFALQDHVRAKGLVTPEFARLIPQTKISHSFFNSFNLYLHLEAKTFLSEVAC